MIVEAIPLTANGKMDRVRTRQWLEEMDEMTYETVMNGNAQDGSDVAATHEEEHLQRILSKVLSLPTVNLNRSFLDLGGRLDWCHAAQSQNVTPKTSNSPFEIF